MPDILTLADSYHVILLDAFGVFWSGGEAGFYPGALEIIRALKAKGKKIAIISNRVASVEKEAAKYQKAGLILGKDYDLMMTSGQMMWDQVNSPEGLPFATPRNTFYVMGDHHPHYGSSYEEVFKTSKYKKVDHIKDADFIYIGIPHIYGKDQADPKMFVAEVKTLVDSEKPAVCANPDEFAHEGNPPHPVVRQGSIAKLFEKLGGKVFYFGKPDPQIFEKVLKLLGVEDRSAALMVGDTPRTDIRGANAAGIKAVLVTETGIAAEEMHQRKQGKQAYIGSLSSGDTPAYDIPCFAPTNLLPHSRG